MPGDLSVPNLSGGIIRGLATPQSAVKSDSDELAAAVSRGSQTSGVGIQVNSAGPE